VERLKESRTPGLLGSKKNFAMEIATKPLVMASEIAGLEPPRGYIKQENRVIPVKFALVKKRILQPEFMERKTTISEPRRLPSPTETRAQTPELVQPFAVEPCPSVAARQPREGIGAVSASKLELASTLFAEPAPEKAAPPEPRKSAFKKKEGMARKWKPVD
jgi:hypothetical protein